MKNLFFFLTLLSIIAFSCKSSEKDDTTATGVTREEVVAIAKKYGLQDSIAEGYVSPRFKPFPPEAYPALSKAFWESYFANWRKFSDKDREFQQYRQEMVNITSVEEYYQLIEKFPLVHQSRIDLHGGIEAYNRKKMDDINGNWHLYLANDGAIVFLPSDSDDGAYPGKRLDKSK